MRDYNVTFVAWRAILQKCTLVQNTGLLKAGILNFTFLQCHPKLEVCDIGSHSRSEKLPQNSFLDLSEMYGKSRIRYATFLF